MIILCHFCLSSTDTGILLLTRTCLPAGSSKEEKQLNQYFSLTIAISVCFCTKSSRSLHHSPSCVTLQSYLQAQKLFPRRHILQLKGIDKESESSQIYCIFTCCNPNLPRQDGWWKREVSAPPEGCRHTQK